MVDCEISTADTESMKIINQAHPVVSAILLASFTISSLLAAGDTQSGSSSEAKEAAARLAVDTLSEKLSVGPESIEVVHVSIMDWPDSSLGCPRPGFEYLQVITRGSVVLLQADQKTYRVHIGNDQAIVCETALKSASARRPKALAGQYLQDLMQTAKKDLAQRLGLAPAEISISMVESMTWPDSALGCPAPEGDYIEADVRGFRITLDHNGQSFRYHTNQQRVIPCPSIELE